MKLYIKTLAGEIYFEHEMEGNSIKETVKAMLEKFRGEWIKNVNLSEEDLSDIDFSGSTFDNSTFDNSKFYNSKFDNSKFYNSKFDNSKFDNSKFDNSKFDNSTFYNSTFDNSTFDDATVKNIIASNQLSMFDAYKHDLWAVLLKAKKEIPGLKAKIISGEIDGTKYEGACACLKGTIANIRGCNYAQIPGMKADSSEPSERWFLMLKKGMTPENSEIAKLTLSWIEEFEMYLNQ